MHVRVSLVILVIFWTDSTCPMQCFPRCRTIYSITDFVNTRDHIWTYKISKQTVIRCQYNKMRSISLEHYIYNRTFWYREQRKSIRLRGDFDAQRKNRMDVRSIETLIYLANNTACGVVRIEPARNGTTYYELRVKNAYIGAMPDRKCTSRFRRVANFEMLTYSPDCHHLLGLRH
ncbi:uncharacterized protein LOC119372164 [Rhipicephalus sanguineus]|uniref:uncharacterized protein LOC119372164 n=1 Tax=Rhipicephalus sanguineus TaxID=34632 RepID=UPI001893FF25|nr:uncharacterized protein LOC119372164 [Rhipicephalus sanguineus]